MKSPIFDTGHLLFYHSMNNQLLLNANTGKKNKKKMTVNNVKNKERVIEE